MAMDAGTIVFKFPADGQATDAALGATTVGATDRAFFLAHEPLDVAEVGCNIGTATAADTFAFTVATAPNIGGAYTVKATVTGPAATILPAGARLKKNVNFRANAGDVIRVTVSDAAAAGTAQFYVKCYPAGDAAVGSEDRISST